MNRTPRRVSPTRPARPRTAAAPTPAPPAPRAARSFAHCPARGAARSRRASPAEQPADRFRRAAEQVAGQRRGDDRAVRALLLALDRFAAVLGEQLRAKADPALDDPRQRADRRVAAGAERGEKG